MAESSFLCPYCFDVSALMQTEYFCKSCDAYKQIPSQGRQNIASRQCPDCNQTQAYATCPRCHRKLPEATLTGDNTIISIVGTRGAGKSHYVASLIDEMIHRVAPDFSGSFVGFADTNKTFVNKFGVLYNTSTSRTLDATPPNTREDPLIYEMKILKDRKLKMYTFAFFDTAGENFGDEEQMAVLNKYIYQSSGIICLLDPFQIPGLSDRVSAQVRDGSSAGIAQTSNRDVVAHVSNLIRNYRQMKSTDRINVPIAIAFTKLDALAEVLPEGSIVLDPSGSCGEVNEEDIHNVSQEIEAFLYEFGEQAFVQMVKNDYTKSSFFGISALGLDNVPEAGTGKVQKPRPHRVEDPLLWILRENGMLGGSGARGFRGLKSWFKR